MALLIIPVLKGWSRARGLYDYLQTWNWPIIVRKISQLYNKLTYYTVKIVINRERVVHTGVSNFRLDALLSHGQYATRPQFHISGTVNK